MLKLGADEPGDASLMAMVRTPGPRTPAADAPLVTGTPERPSGRLAALDGLRGVAVLAVMAFHSGLSAVKGGLLGVDVFFVLSGFLITALLLSEHARTGRISLAAFWRRRFRRLLPAMLLMLAVVVLVWRYTADVADLPSLRRDAISTIGYVANWHFAADGQSYFDHFKAPSPLLHMWSLAVEEQFYLLWPGIVLLVLRFGDTRWLRRLAVVGALVSTALLTLLATTGVSTSRLYYGTDTRVAALLIGAALATLITPFGSAEPQEPGPRRTQLVAGVLGVVSALALFAAIVAVDGKSPELYRGGFLAVAMLVGVLLASTLLAPRAPMGRLLSTRPLRALGRISYGLYLWHWPVFLFLSSERVGLGGFALLGLRVAVTGTIALVSWLLLERWFLRAPLAGRRALALPAVALIGATVLLVAPLPAPRAGSTGALDLNALEKQSEAAPPPPAASGTVLGRPVRVMISGDSTALTLGVGFAMVAQKNQTTIYDRGLVGCGISTYSPIRAGGEIGNVIDSCRSWPNRYDDDVASFSPDVAVLLLGRWEAMDRWFNGRWAHLGEPDFDAYMAGRLDYAISLLSARGARVALMTAPAYDSRNLPDGSAPAEDDPDRLARWNDLLRDAAARNPATVRVYDLASVLDPHGGFQRYSDDEKLELRAADGIHIAPQGGMLAGDQILPQLVAWTRETASGTTGTTSTTGG